MSDVTGIRLRIESGDPSAADKLLPLVYEELRKLAAQKMTQEKPGQTLQATALVHEAYLRLAGIDKAQHWDSRGHFFAAAAEAMRRIMVERARCKRRVRHGGNFKRTTIDSGIAELPSSTEDLLALDEALTRFEAESPEKAQLVKLRFFAGMTIPQAAELLNISHATAERHWTYARCWLRAELDENDEPRNGGKKS